jgi:hypothetical protein
MLACTGVIEYYITTSLIHGDSDYHLQEIVMKTQFSQKLAALGVALLMNGAIVGTVALLFGAQLAGAQTTEIRLAAV